MGTENKLQGVDILRQKIKYVSHKAGVYRMLDEDGKVLIFSLMISWPCFVIYLKYPENH